MLLSSRDLHRYTNKVSSSQKTTILRHVGLNITRLKRRQAAHKTFVRKTLKKVDELLQEYDEANKGKLRALCDTINEKLGILDKLDTGIIEQAREDDFDKETEEASELKVEMQEIVVNIELSIRFDSSSDEGEDDEDEVRRSLTKVKRKRSR